MESEKTTDRIYYLFQKSNSILVDSDWSKSKIYEVVEDILKTKQAVLCRHGNYSHVSDPLVRRRLNPIQTLFLWALMTQKFEMAEILWFSSVEDGLVLAMVGSAFCRKISKYKISRAELTEAKKYEKKFEDHAIRILEIINETDPTIVPILMLKCIDGYGRLSLLEIAVNGHSTAFIAHPVTQAVLNKIWWGRISKNEKYIVEE